jgi:uncharacterized protein
MRTEETGISPQQKVLTDISHFNCYALKKFYLPFLIGFTIFQFSCGPSPGLGTDKRQNPADSSKTKTHPDSTKYIPKAIGWTNDFVHLFSEHETESLDSLIGAYEKKTTVQFSVATIDSSMMGPIDFESYTLLMFRTWGVGTKEKNNGILIAIDPALKRIRIQNGYGIEKVLTNGQTKTIIDEIFIPYFREGKFYQGTKEGILAMINKLEKNGL